MTYDEYGMEGFEYWANLCRSLINEEEIIRCEGTMWKLDQEAHKLFLLHTDSLSHVTGWVKDRHSSLMHYKNGRIYHYEITLPTLFGKTLASWRRGELMHRENGPAVLFANGHRRFWLDGVDYPIARWLQLVDLSEEHKAMLKLRWS